LAAAACSDLYNPYDRAAACFGCRDLCFMKGPFRLTVGRGVTMSVLKKLLQIAKNLIIVLSFVSGFIIGAIFGETVIDRCGEPTPLTYFLAK
jgi:hypothetical protein